MGNMASGSRQNRKDEATYFRFVAEELDFRLFERS